MSDDEIMTDSSVEDDSVEDEDDVLDDDEDDEEIVVKDEDKLKFKVLTAKQIMEKPLELIKELNEVLQVHPMIARQVLQYFNWNKENALSR